MLVAGIAADVYPLTFPQGQMPDLFNLFLFGPVFVRPLPFFATRQNNFPPFVVSQDLKHPGSKAREQILLFF